MTEQEKADEIISFYSKVFEGNYLENGGVKKCALIHVDGIIEVLGHFAYSSNMYDNFETGEVCYDNKPFEYWNKVKEIINNI